MSVDKQEYKKLPSVDKILKHKEIELLIHELGRPIVLYSVRNVLESLRADIKNNLLNLSLDGIIALIVRDIDSLNKKSLKKVINATGVILNTNLGRAPINEQLFDESKPMVCGYSNLEFDVLQGKRGNRNSHTVELLKYLTGTEDALVVNNNAAAVMLILRTFAKRKEVVISRSELIEIGGSFRIPEIMAASDCKMIEVGTTNKSYITDFEKVINPKTALLFKAHKSNYVIKGFTHEVDIKQLVDLGVSHSIPVVFDQGSGLLDNTISPFFENESDIKSAIELGVDLVSFSGDKLLGGPQAGIIVGKKKYIDKLKKEPMLRALRVCKLTLSVLESTLQTYINPKKIAEKNATYSALLRNENEIKKLAQRLVDEFRTLNISSEIESSQGFCGGGTLPEKSINSFAVYLNFNGSKKQQVLMAEKMHHHLLMQQTPVLSVLKSGKIYFDVLCLYEKDIAQIISAVENVNQSKSV